MNPHPPLALDPGNIRALQPSGPSAKPDPALTGLEAAFAAAHSKLVSVANLQAALGSDPTLPPAAKAARLRAAALRAGEAVAQQLDDAASRLATIIATTRAESLPMPPADPILASEIRAALRSMPRPARQKALAEAVAGGDGATVGAALSGPAMLSGQGAGERELLATDWRRHRHPEALERLARLERAAEAVARAGKAALAFVEPLAVDPQALLAEKAAQATEEALNAMEA